MRGVGILARIVVAAAIVWVVLLPLSFLPGAEVGKATEPTGTASTGVASALHLLSVALLVAAVVLPIRLSSLRGSRRVAAVFLALVGLNVILTNIEALAFLDVAPGEVGRWIAVGTLQVAVVAVVAVLMFGRSTPEPAAPVRVSGGGPQGVLGWTWRFAVCSLAYVLLYFIAGMLIYPFIRDWYETQLPPPDLGPLVVLQLVRGALYAAFAMPLLRSLVATRRRTALTLGILFPLAAGVAPLVMDNPVMPIEIRAIHLVEITWSNFAFGLLVGSLFWAPRGEASEEEGT